MRVLVDTNILLRSAQPNHPLCSQATHAVAKLIRQKQAVFFCPQNIAEFWNVATRFAELNGLGLSHEEVLHEVSSIESLLTLLPDIPAIYATWKQIVKDHRIQGVKVYDARLVATMYYAMLGTTCVLLLCGGDKRKQASDINRAIEYLHDYKERTRKP